MQKANHEQRKFLAVIFLLVFLLETLSFNFVLAENKAFQEKSPGFYKRACKNIKEWLKSIIDSFFKKWERIHLRIKQWVEEKIASNIKEWYEAKKEVLKKEFKKEIEEAKRGLKEKISNLIKESENFIKDII